MSAPHVSFAVLDMSEYLFQFKEIALPFADSFCRNTRVYPERMTVSCHQTQRTNRHTFFDRHTG